MWNSVVVAFASALTVIGLILLPLPVPMGALVFATGLTLLVSRSDRAANVLKLIRMRSRWLDRGFRFLEDRSPNWITSILVRTRP